MVSTLYDVMDKAVLRQLFPFSESITMLSPGEFQLSFQWIVDRNYFEEFLGQWVHSDFSVEEVVEEDGFWSIKVVRTLCPSAPL